MPGHARHFRSINGIDKGFVHIRQCFDAASERVSLAQAATLPSINMCEPGVGVILARPGGAQEAIVSNVVFVGIISAETEVDSANKRLKQ